jgi:hypothetical protein
MTTMTPNTILDELHAVRRQILADYKGDTAAYLRAAQARLEASGRPIAHRKQRTIRCTVTAKSAELALENCSAPDDR